MRLLNRLMAVAVLCVLYGGLSGCSYHNDHGHGDGGHHDRDDVYVHDEGHGYHHDHY